MVAKKLPDWLPAGWTEQAKVKKNRKVKCYVDPLTGRTFYSKPQVSEYLRTVKHSSSASKQKKMGTISPIMCQLTGGNTTLKREGSQFRTRSSSKRIDIGFSNEAVEKPKMDEIIGGKTSLKKEESQNVKTLKQTSCKSKRKLTGNTQPVNKVVIERVTPDGLPPGWRKEIKIQKKANGTRKDQYYTDPVSGYVFFSQKDALRYLETGDFNRCSIKPKKRVELGFLDEEETSDKMGELSGATDSCKLRGSQNVKIPRSPASKPKQMGSTEQPAGKVVIERVTVDGLPPGWLQELCYTDPVSGYVFFSREDALCYVETGDFDRCIIKPKKRDELGFFSKDTSPNMSKLTGVKDSLKQGGSQNVITRKGTRCISKQNEMGFSKQSAEKSNQVEITGEQASPKQDGSQKVKTPKCTSRLSKQKINGHSKQSVKNVMIERVTPDGLPRGWIKEIRIQKKANGTRKDTFYTDPVSGYVFWSQKDALRYLEDGDINKCTIKPKKRDELEFLNEAGFLISNQVEIAGDQTSPKQEGSQKVKTPKCTSRLSKQKINGHSKQSVENVMIERVTPDGLPRGWIKEIRIQKKASGARKDPFYTDPVSGYVFWSQKDALRYLEDGDINKCTIKPKKRDELGFLNEAGSLISNQVEIAGDQTSPKQEGSQKVMIERVTPDGLPRGWIKEIRIQKKANGTRKDPFYTDPVSGYVFWSQKDALRYLEDGDFNKCTIKPKKRDELGFLNEAGSLILPSVAVTQKLGHNTQKRRLFAGTQNSITRSLETTDAGGARKRQHIREGKLSPGNAIEGADTKERYDPSSSATPITKCSKRKRSKRVGTENVTVSKKKGKSTSSKEKNKSSRKTQIGASKSKKKMSLGVPCRSSARLVGPKSEIVKSRETEHEPSVGPHDDMAHSSPQRFRTVSETEIADYSFKGPEVPPNAVSCGSSAQVKSSETEHEPSVGPHDDMTHSDPQQFQTVSEADIADYSFRGPEVQPNAELSNTCKKNPLEDQAVPEDQPAMEETVKTDAENQDQMNPFGDSWSDPCLEFAFKTLSGEMPIEDNIPTHDNFQEQSENPNPQTGGCSALLDFNIPNFYQNSNVLSDIDALQKPVSDSAPISPTFLASENVSSLFFDSPAKPVSDSVPQLPNSSLFLASGHASSPIFDALPKHVADSVPQLPNSPSFLDSGNRISPVFDAPWKPETYSAPQLPTTQSFLGFGNVSSPNCIANAPAPQQLNLEKNKEPNLEENKEHKLNLNL